MSHLDGKEVVVVLLELRAGGVLREEQLGEILKLWIDHGRREKPIKGYSLQAGGEDPTQDGVIPSIDYYLVLILTEILNRIARTIVVVKGQNSEFFCKFTHQYALGDGRAESIDSDSSESAVMRHPFLLDSLLYKLIEILDADKLLGLSLSMIVLISHTEMRGI